MLIVRSPVRISFGGGGTDLPGYYRRFGGAVLSTSINKYFYTILQKRTDGKIQVISSDLRVMETWHDISRMEVKRSELAIPLAAIQEISYDISVDLFLASEIAFRPYDWELRSRYERSTAEATGHGHLPS